MIQILSAIAALQALSSVLGDVSGFDTDCQQSLMFGITVDASGSISADDFESTISDVVRFVNYTSFESEEEINDNLYYLSYFTENVTEVHAAQFSDDPVVLELFQENGAIALQAKIDEEENSNRTRPWTSGPFRWGKGFTDIYAGLKTISDSFERSEKNLGYAIIVTDGECTWHEGEQINPVHLENTPFNDACNVAVRELADDLRDRGHEVVGVGIGNSTNWRNLKAVVSKNPETGEPLFYETTFDELYSSLTVLGEEICDLDVSVKGVVDTTNSTCDGTEVGAVCIGPKCFQDQDCRITVISAIIGFLFLFCCLGCCCWWLCCGRRRKEKDEESE